MRAADEKHQIVHGLTGGLVFSRLVAIDYAWKLRRHDCRTKTTQLRTKGISIHCVIDFYSMWLKNAIANTVE